MQIFTNVNFIYCGDLNYRLVQYSGPCNLSDCRISVIQTTIWIVDKKCRLFKWWSEKRTIKEAGIQVFSVFRSPLNFENLSISSSISWIYNCKIFHWIVTKDWERIYRRGFKHSGKMCSASTFKGKIMSLRSYYSGDLHRGLVWYSNDQKLSDCWMVQCSNVIWIPD